VWQFAAYQMTAITAAIAIVAVMQVAGTEADPHHCCSQLSAAEAGHSAQ